MNGVIQGISSFVEEQDDSRADSSLREVLVVDDDPATLKLLATVLETSGYAVRTADDGRQAMEMIRERIPDFLVTDWEMPNVNGIELAEWVRQQPFPKYVYTILVTGRTETKHMVQAISAGADDFFSKPVRPGELLARVQAGVRILELERQLRFLARRDQLTGLLNRRTFFESLEEHWNRSLRKGHAMACVMIDIDRFKAVNDRYGHLTGDQALARVAEVLRQCRRESDLVGRYGGEEFCVLLLDCDQRAASDWAERCRLSIAGDSIPVGNTNIHLTASFGVSEKTDGMENPMQLIDAADQALLVAKRGGRNRVVRCGSVEQPNSLEQ